jgi:hypothetical protein
MVGCCEGRGINFVSKSGFCQRVINIANTATNVKNSMVFKVKSNILLDLDSSDDLFLTIVISFVKNFLLVYYDG